MSNIEYSGLDEVQLAILNNARATHVDEDVVVDSDTYLVIDVKTKTIINKSGKSDLVQFDHNSERLTFEVDRYIDGHDVLLCNSIRVEYVGVDNEGIYDVTDVRVNPDDKSKVIFTWLITSNVTQNIGNIKFVVIFECLQEDSTVNYSWSTKVHETLTVVKGIRNESTIMIKSIDILDQWRNEILTDFVEATIEASESAQTASAQAQQNATIASDSAVIASEARNYVESVVAGNEAYTKYESDVKYAPVIVQSVSGTDILVQDSSNRPVESISVFGKCTQDTEPTPDNPIEPSGVGELGYNDGEYLQGFIQTDGSIVANATMITSKNPIPCKGGDVVKLTYPEIVATMCFGFYDENMTIISRPYVGSVSEYENVAPPNTRYVKFHIQDTRGITPATAKKIVVTINHMYALIVKCVSKNQLNNTADDFEGNGVTRTINKDKSITVNGSPVSNASFAKITQTVKAGKWIFSGCPKGGSSTTYSQQISLDNDASYLYDYGNGVEFELEEDTEVIFYLARIRNGYTATNLIFYPMLRPVSTSVDYIPHEEYRQYIAIGSSLKGIGGVVDELKGVNSGYKVERKFSTVIYDGSDDEGWSSMTTYADRFYIPASKLPNLKPRTVVICSHYTYSANLATVDYGIYLGNDLNIKNKDITTLADFKARLAENPITVVCEVDSPETEIVIHQVAFEDLHTFKPVTHITASDGAEMTIEYIADTKTYIDNKLKELVGVSNE